MTLPFKILVSFIALSLNINHKIVLFHLTITYPLAVEQLVIDLEKHSVTLSVAVTILSVPKIAIRPIVDTVSVTLAVKYLAIISITVGIDHFFESIG